MIEILSDIDSTDWQELIDISAVSTFFQTPQCYHFYESLPFLTPFKLAVKENNLLVGVAIGYIISDGGNVKSYFSRRAIIPGGILLHKDISYNAIQALLSAIKKHLKHKAIYIEMRNYNSYELFKKPILNSGFKYNEHLNFHVKTFDLDSATKQLSSTKRRDVKISLANGAEVIQTSDINDVKCFYSLLSDLYKTKIKLPLFPYVFFENIISVHECRLFVVKYDNKVIGGSLCMELRDKALYEWFVCGLDREIKNVYPSTLATWAAIEYSAKNNIDRLDMMGAGKPDDAYGVRDFKAKFGGELVEHGRFIYVTNKLLFGIGKLGIKLLKK
ncbi:MAG: peptidoglycan bridge formation glycyltransferase FemA/FemB family protein [Bacteroidales bacterium]